MWVRAAAIRPVPPYAIVDRDVMATVEADFATEDEGARTRIIERAVQRFEETQEPLAGYVSGILERPLDGAALALGNFLSITVWLAFERAFSRRLGCVTEDAIRATLDAVALEEELRAEHGEEPLDVDDVVAIEQPAILRFVNDHVDAALEVGDAPGEIDVDDVHVVYRAMLVLTLALSHAVEPQKGIRATELLA